MTNTRSEGQHEGEAPANPELIEVAIGAENMRRMFRQTMARRALEAGEELAKARERLSRDPATARLAELLGSTVEELLQGFGQAERFITGAAYDHEAEKARVDAIVDRVASRAIGLNDGRHADALERTAARRSGPIAAPHVEASSRRASGGDEVRRMISERASHRPADRTPRVTKSFSDRWRSRSV